MKANRPTHPLRTGRGGWVLLIGLAGLVGLPGYTHALDDSVVPSRDSEIIATLRPASLTAAGRELRTLRASLSKDPLNLSLAREVASQLILQSRIESDPRCLGFAQTALAPWWTNASPPIDVLVLRATIHQSLHSFPSALADLDAALTLNPRHAQAWLTKATIHTVCGQYEQARRACVPLLRLSDPLTATTAAATVASLTGGAGRSVDLLEAALRREPDAAVTVRIWALTQLAESTARLGRLVESEGHFRTALSLAPRDPYLLGAYADLLLDLHRPDDAAALVEGSRSMDGLRLRFAEARLAGGHSASSEIQDLTERFAAARARGDRVHQREEGRFQLRLLRSPASALALAQENWHVQKEPADARLLLESARAMNDVTVETQVLAWVTTNRLEDVHLRARR